MIAGSVNIPVTLGVAGFTSQLARISTQLNTFASVARTGAILAGAGFATFGAVAIPALASVVSGVGLVGTATANSARYIGASLAKIPTQPFGTTLLGIRNLNDAIQQFVAKGLLNLLGINQKFAASDFLLAPFSAATRQVLLLKITANGVDAALGNLAIAASKGIGGILGNFGKLSALQNITIGAGILAGILTLNRVMPLLNTSISLVTLSFSQLIPNLATNLALMKAINSLTKGGLLAPARYQDWVTLAAILAGMLPTSSLLKKTLETIAIPIKFTRNLQSTLNLFNLLRSEVSRIVAETNQLTVGLATSAASLAQGGGFLLPGQMPVGPTAFDMFNKEQALEQVIAFEQMSRGYESVLKVTGSGRGQIQGLTRDILQLQGSSGQSLPELTAMAGALSRSGNSADDARAQVSAYAHTATATGESATQLARGINQLLQSYEISVNETTTVTDQLTAVSFQTGTAVTALANSMNSAASIATTSNQSFQDVLLGIGLLASKSIEGSTAANGLSNTLINLQRALKETSQETGSGTTRSNALQVLGITPQDITNAQGQLIGLSQLLPVLQQKIATFTAAKGEAATVSLLSSIFGVQNVDVVQALVSQSVSDINQLQSAIASSGGLAKKVSDEQMGTLSGTIERLSAAAQGVSITLGQFLAPVFNALLQPLTASVEGFLRLPPVIQATAFSLSVLLPVMLMYFQGAKAYLYAAKAWVLLQNTLNVTMGIYTGIVNNSTRAVTLNTIATTVGNEAKKIALFLTNLQGNAVALLTGKMSLQTAQQKLFNQFQLIGAANSKEFFGTTLKAAGIFLKHAAVLGLAVGAVWGLSQAYKSFTSGQEFVNQVNSNTQAIVRFQAELTKTPGLMDQSGDAWNQFLETLKNKGSIEAAQVALADLDRAMGGGSDSTSDYGNQGFGAFITNTQLANQRAIEVLDKQFDVLDQTYARGQGVLQKYQVEQLSAGETLNSEQYQAFTKEASDQIQIIDKWIKKLREQKAPTEAQQQLINSNISVLEKQKNILRGRVEALNTDTDAATRNANAQKAINYSLQELTAEHEKQTRILDLTAEKQRTLSAEALANGADEREVTQQNLTNEREAINERIKLNEQLQSRLKTAATGAVGEEAGKIADQEQKTELEAQKLKTQLAENAYKLRQENNRKALADEQMTAAKASSAIQTIERDKVVAIRQLQLGKVIDAGEADRQIAQAKAASTSSELQSEAEKLGRLRVLRASGVIDAEKFAQDELSITNRIGDLKANQVEAAVAQAEALKQKQIQQIEQVATIQKAASDKAVTGLEKQIQATNQLLGVQDRAKQLLEAQSGLTSAIASSDQGRTQGQIDLLSKAAEARKRLASEELAVPVREALQGQLGKLGFSGSELDLIRQRQSLEDKLAKQKQAALLQEQKMQQQLMIAEQLRAKLTTQIALTEARIADIKSRQAEIEAKANLQKTQISGEKGAIASAQAQLEAAQLGRQAAGDGIKAAQEGISIQQKLATTARQTLEVQQKAAKERMAEANRLREFDQAVELAEAQARTQPKAKAKVDEQVQLNWKLSKEQIGLVDVELAAKSNLAQQDKQLVDGQIKSQEDLKKATLERIEATRKAEEFRINQQAARDTLGIKQKLLAKGGGEVAKRQADEEIAKVEQTKTLSELDLIRDRLADNDRLEKLLIVTAKEASETRRSLQQQLLQTETQLTDQRLAAQERVKQQEVRAADELLAKYRLKSEVAIAALDREKAAVDRLNKSLDFAKQLIESRANLQKANADLAQVGTQNQLDVFDRALSARQKLNSDNLSDLERGAIEGQLASVGLGGANEADILNQKFALENQIAAQKRQAMEQEQAVARQLLEVDLARNQLAAQLAVTESKILNAKARQAEIEAKANLDKARLSGDASQTASAQIGVQTADLSKEAAAQAMEMAQTGLAVQQETAANARQALSAQQSAAEAQFQGAEGARQWNQNLAQAEGAAKGIAQASKAASSTPSSSSNAASATGGKGYTLIQGSKEWEQEQEARKAFMKTLESPGNQKNNLLNQAMGSQEKNPWFSRMLESYGFGEINKLASQLKSININPIEVSRIQQDANFNGGDAIAELKMLGDKIEKLANRPSVGTLQVSTPQPTGDAMSIMRDLSASR